MVPFFKKRQYNYVDFKAQRNALCHYHGNSILEENVM